MVAAQNEGETPAAQPTTFGSMRVVVPWSARLFALLRMLLGFFIALSALGIVFDPPPANTVETGVLVIVYVTALTVLPFAAISFWSNMRSAFARDARLELLSDRLAIYHGGVFSRPFAISWDDVEAVAFDDRPFRYKRSGDHKRFRLDPEPTEEDSPLDWLYSRAGGAPLPLLGQVFDVPNTAVLFTEPKVLRPIRRWQKAFPSKVRMGPPIHKRKSRGLLIRVKDAAALRAVLDPWGVVKPITSEMLQAHAPPESDRARARRSMWRDDIILFGLLIGQAAIPVLIALAD